MTDSYYDPDKFRLLQYGEVEPYIKEWTLKVPVAVAIGHLEKLTDEELTDLRSDVGAEQSRRNALLANGENHD